MKIRRLAAFLAVVAPLTACVSSSDSTTPSPNPNAGFQARFTPLGGMMPFPNDLYFNGSTDGTLNIPGDTAVSQNGPLLELNHLDGYGTQSDINIYFTAKVKESTLSANVSVFKVDSDVSTKAVKTTGTVTKLQEGTDYSVGLSPGIDAGGEIVTIKPLHPLAASAINGSTPVPATYLVVVTDGVTDTSGKHVSASADYSAILQADLPVLTGGSMGTTGNAQLDQVALFTLPQLAVAAQQGIDPKKIAVSFSFSTQYAGVSLALLAAQAQATTQSGTAIVDTGLTVCQVLVAAGQMADAATCTASVPGGDLVEVFAGDVALPYYLPIPNAAHPTAALTGSWKNELNGGDTGIGASSASFLPRETRAHNVIPILVAVPLAGSGCAMPGSGWPVAIFQHGITRNREDMLAIASALAVGGAPTFCNAVMAIDLPLHGVTDKTDPFYKNQLFTGTAAAPLFTAAVSERTFDMDLQDNASGASGADGGIDGSGAWFINLNSTLTSRDNLREGAADLINLVATLPNLSAITPPSTVNIFDDSKVFFVGHSLGGIVGIDFLGADSAAAQLTATAPKISAAVLAAPGGHIAELLRKSPTFGPIIDQGLAEQGLVQNSQAYFDFYSEAQAVVEDGDPANYAAAAAAGHLIHMIEVVGGANASSPPDTVVPNSATDVLIAQMGITTPVSALGNNAIAAGAPTLAQFTTGDHGSILDPTPPDGVATADKAGFVAVTTEMQTETATLFVTTLAGAPSTVITDNTFLSTTLVK
ncbi:MAG TPA: hypothetical protein VF651_01135 [Gammaproteobacteria bacterium]